MLTASAWTRKRVRRAAWVGILTALTLLPATQARAAGGTPLPFDALYRLVVDGAHDQEFVSGGPGTDKLVVMDGTGSIATTILMQGPTGMVLVRICSSPRPPARTSPSSTHRPTR